MTNRMIFLALILMAVPAFAGAPVTSYTANSDGTVTVSTTFSQTETADQFIAWAEQQKQNGSVSPSDLSNIVAAEQQAVAYKTAQPSN